VGVHHRPEDAVMEGCGGKKAEYRRQHDDGKPHLSSLAVRKNL